MVIKEFGKHSFECEDLPMQSPVQNLAPIVKYKDVATKLMPFESDLKSYTDITPQSVKLAFERLCKINAVDLTSVRRC